MSFDDLLDAAANERLARRAGLAMDAAPGMNGLSPDQEAQECDLAARSKLPLEIVRADPQAVVDRLTRAQRDQILASSPVLSAYAQDPHNAALVQDDLEELSALGMAVDGVRDYFVSVPDVLFRGMVGALVSLPDNLYSGPQRAPLGWLALMHRWALMKRRRWPESMVPMGLGRLTFPWAGGLL